MREGPRTCGTGTVDARMLARELAGAMPALDGRHQRIALALYRLLAEGEPVEAERLAEHAGLARDEVEALLDDWPGVFREDGRVVGFWGVALAEMSHRLHVDGRELRAWCAWDTLFLPELLGRRSRVESACALTGQPVTLTVDPKDGVRDLSPPTAVVSFLRPDKPFDAQVITSFCHFVHFFRDEDAGREWTAGREGTFLMSIDDAHEIGRLTNEANFGAMLRAAR